MYHTRELGHLFFRSFQRSISIVEVHQGVPDAQDVVTPAGSFAPEPMGTGE
jgi:hypothetical protein